MGNNRLMCVLFNKAASWARTHPSKTDPLHLVTFISTLSDSTAAQLSLPLEAAGDCDTNCRSYKLYHLSKPGATSQFLQWNVQQGSLTQDKTSCYQTDHLKRPCNINRPPTMTQGLIKQGININLITLRSKERSLTAETTNQKNDNTAAALAH